MCCEWWNPVMEVGGVSDKKRGEDCNLKIIYEHKEQSLSNRLEIKPLKFSFIPPLQCHVSLPPKEHLVQHAQQPHLLPFHLCFHHFLGRKKAITW